MKHTAYPCVIGSSAIVPQPVSRSLEALPSAADVVFSNTFPENISRIPVPFDSHAMHLAQLLAGFRRDDPSSGRQQPARTSLSGTVTLNSALTDPGIQQVPTYLIPPTRLPPTAIPPACFCPVAHCTVFAISFPSLDGPDPV